jgi:hypothetical protein
MPDGSIMHAEVQIDDTVVMIADGADDNPAFPIWLHVYVPEVDASYQRALDAGGLSVDEPKQREGDPDRRAGVKDRQAILGGLLPSSVKTSLQDALFTQVYGRGVLRVGLDNGQTLSGLFATSPPVAASADSGAALGATPGG